MERDELDEEQENDTNDNVEESPSSEDSPSSSGEVEGESSSPKLMSFFAKIKELWNKIPITTKITIIINVAKFFLIMLAVAFLVFVIASPTEEAENLWQATGSGIDEFFEKLGNLFTGHGFVDDEEKAKDAEKSYYEKLDEVAKYYEDEYNVKIDTTLITATLFYGKGMSDYVEDDEAISQEKKEDSVADSDENIYQDDKEDDGDVYEEATEFYKLAKRHIKTLAKFQIYEEASYNACIDEGNPEVKIEPESAYEIANETWLTALYGFNQQVTFNNQLYEDKSYTDIEGNVQEIIWCDYKNPEKQLTKAYENDKEIYIKRKNAYEACKRMTETSCMSSCGTKAPYLQAQCEKECKERDYSCASLKESMEEAKDAYEARWINEGMFDDEGNFSCVSTSTWGILQKNTEDVYTKPYEADPTWINRETLPTKLEVYSGNYVECSTDSPIRTYYSTGLNTKSGLIEREGVYYYKLLSRSQDFLSGKNFIEKYYPEFVTDTDPDRAMEDATAVVEDIFDLYEFVAERDTMFCLTPSTSSGGSYASKDRAEFISMIANEVVLDMQNTGVLASITIAQAAIESRNGNSKLSQPPYNNYYGMTAGGCMKGSAADAEKGRIYHYNENGNGCTGNAYWNGDVVRMCNSSGADCQWYRVYDGFSNSTLDHSRLLSSSKYQCNGISTSEATISCIKGHGYATDPNYISTVLGVVKTYDLDQYNIAQWNGETITGEGSIALGTVCYNASNEVINGEGTIASSNGAQGIRSELWGTSDYETFWGSKNNIFYPKYVQECTWYSHGRGLEILTKNGMSLETAKKYMNPMQGDAYKWFGQNQYFSSSTDVNQPKVGAIIVWSNGSEAGHVAIIEDIIYDSNGNVESITTSEGGRKIHGFKYTEGRTLDWVKAHSTYKFTGYVYLLD